MQIVPSIEGHDTEVRARFSDLFLKFIQDGNRFYLPVHPGMSFRFSILNRASQMRAYPLILEAPDGSVRNTFLNDTATDPNAFLSDGGMMEAGESGSDFARLLIKGFALPHKRVQQFVLVNDGLGVNGFNANRFKLYVRTPVDPTMTIDKLDHLKRGGRGAVGGGEVIVVERSETHVEYNPDAALIADITVITREEGKAMLAQANVAFDGRWNF